MSKNINVDLVVIQKYQNIYIKIYELPMGGVIIWWLKNKFPGI
jgi:hypothetical protein